MSYRTLAELESDIRYRYDIEGFTARHPQAQIFRLINDAYRALRDRLTSDGATLFLVSLEGTQTTVGKSANYPGTVLANSIFGNNNLSVITEVHCKVGGYWRPLAHHSFADALTDSDAATTGVPQAWALAGVSLESASGTSTGQALNILITPALDQVREFRVVGTLSWSDLTSATDRMMTDLGLHEYIIASVGVDLIIRDDNAALWDRRFAERERVYADVRKRTKHRDPGPKRRIDVRWRRGVSW